MIFIATSNSTVGFFNVASKVSKKTSGTVSVEQSFDDFASDLDTTTPIVTQSP